MTLTLMTSCGSDSSDTKKTVDWNNQYNQNTNTQNSSSNQGDTQNASATLIVDFSNYDNGCSQIKIGNITYGISSNSSSNILNQMMSLNSGDYTVQVSGNKISNGASICTDNGTTLNGNVFQILWIN
jgi:hypothetical protein